MIAMQKSAALPKSSGVDVEKAKEVERRLSQNPIRKSKFKQVEAFCYLAGRKSADEALTSLTENCGEGMTGLLKKVSRASERTSCCWVLKTMIPKDLRRFSGFFNAVASSSIIACFSCSDIALVFFRRGNSM